MKRIAFAVCVLVLTVMAFALPEDFDDSSGNPWINWESHGLPSYGTTQPTTQPSSNTAWSIVYCRYYPAMQYGGGGAPNLTNLTQSGYGPWVFPTYALAVADIQRFDVGSNAFQQIGVPSTRVYLPNFKPASGDPITPDGAIYIDWNGSVANPAIAIEGDVIEGQRVSVASNMSYPGPSGAASNQFTVQLRWDPPWGVPNMPNQLTMVVAKVEGPESEQDGEDDSTTQPAPTSQPIIWNHAKTVMELNRPIYVPTSQPTAPSFSFQGAALGAYTPVLYTVNLGTYGKHNFVPLQYMNNLMTAFFSCIAFYWVLEEFKRQ